MATLNDFTTDVAKVRGHIPDVAPVFNSAEPGGPKEYMLTDEHIQMLIDTSRGTGNARIFRAAAAAIEMIGTNQAIVSKVIQTEDLRTDGAKLLSAMLQRVPMLRKQADDIEADEFDAFIVIPLPTIPYHWEPR